MRDTVLKSMGVIEMSHNDMQKTEGGIFLLIGIAVGMVAGYYMTKTLDEATR